VNKNLSIYLDLMRFLAAIIVVATHVSTLSHLGYIWHLRLLGHDAVVIFFVLSGFVIAFTAGSKDLDLGAFAVSRLSRLYSVLLPCLIITPLLTLWGQNIDPGTYIKFEPTSLQAIVENAFFLNQIWLEYTIYFANIPMWSLSYEFWYYVIFGAAFFLSGRARAVAIIAACLIAGPKIMMLLPVWMMGVGVHHIIRRGISARLGAMILFVSAVALLVYVLLKVDLALNEWSIAFIGRSNIPDYYYSKYFIADNALGLLVSANFIGVAGIANHIRFGAAAPLIRGAAGFTFSIYLFHYPIMLFCNAVMPHDLSAYWRLPAIFIMAVSASCILGLFSERKKHLYVRPLEAIRARWFLRPRPVSLTS
jgi:peptidoglycan/LPS O-acetylase OafA/YrhL